MQELDDIALLRKYVEHDSEEAFAALVARHINKVYSAAWRHTGNPQQAEEITQAVFVILARKSANLGKRVILSGWLYQTARLTAVTFIRSQIRRAHREQEAYMQTVLNDKESNDWTQIAPLLDAAMAALNEADRHAVVLRFFDGKSMNEVGAALGANEDAAKKRVSRALEKLRKFFEKRGVSSTAATIAGAISANSVQAAPIALAKTITAVAMTKGVAASGSTLTLIKGALKIMAWTKAKTAAVVGVALILTAGTTTLAIRHEFRQRANDPMLMAGFSKSANQSLQGHWTGSNTAHPGKTCTVTISGDQIEYRGADPNDWLRGTFVLDDNSMPQQLNITILDEANKKLGEPANSFVFGIYQIDGNKITIAVAPHESNLRPMNFTPGSGVDVLELQHD